jgi:hypothetical protein
MAVAPKSKADIMHDALKWYAISNTTDPRILAWVKDI